MGSIPGAKLVRVTSDAAAWTGGTVLYAVYLFGGSNATSVQLTDDADGLSDNTFEVNTVANQGTFVDMSELGGIAFPSVGIYADITGTGAVAYLWIA